MQLHNQQSDSLVGQGSSLVSVDLTQGDYSSRSNNEVFLLDLPSDGDMDVTLADGTRGVFSFREGTSPVVAIKKVWNAGSTVKNFQIIY